MPQLKPLMKMLLHTNRNWLLTLISLFKTSYVHPILMHISNHVKTALEEKRPLLGHSLREKKKTFFIFMTDCIKETLKI